MILTDREVQIALDNGLVAIDPRPGPEALSSTSIDLTLASTFARWPAVGGLTIRPGHSNYRYADLAKVQEVVEADTYTLESNSFVLAWSAETVSIPANSRLAARVEGKSSLARLGICVHITAPTIHSGFQGRIQLEMVNFGPNTILLDSGMRICQLIFEQTAGTPEKGYQGMFAKQQPKTPSRKSRQKKK
jgi:dCTP deaminase